MKLSEEDCRPVAAGAEPLKKDEARELISQVPQWSMKNGEIEKDYKFKDFNEAVAFVNRVAELAGRQDHHPDICISYNKVHLALSTHKAGGLTRNDFIMAARIAELDGSGK